MTSIKRYETNAQEINNSTGHIKYEMQYESQQEELSSADRGYEPIENCY